MQENNLMYLLREMSGAKNGKQREATILFVSALNSVQTKDGCSYSMKALGWVNVMLCEFESIISDNVTHTLIEMFQRQSLFQDCPFLVHYDNCYSMRR